MARYDLTPTQFKALEILTNPEHYNKSYEEKATMIGVHPNTLYNYRHNEKFQKALDNARKDILNEAVIPIIKQAIKGALGKSHPDRKMLLEIAGIYSPKIDATISHIIEIVPPEGIDEDDI